MSITDDWPEARPTPSRLFVKAITDAIIEADYGGTTTEPCVDTPMASENDKPRIHNPDFAADPEIETFRYRGPDRREQGPLYIEEFIRGNGFGEMTFDADGNPVWQLVIEIPRRRKSECAPDFSKDLRFASFTVEDNDGRDDLPRVARKRRHDESD